MALAGWQILHIDVDLTGDQPKAQIKMERSDGRWLLASVDGLGRANFETFQRSRCLGMSTSTKGRRPLAPQVDDVFLGRHRCRGASHLIMEMTAYIADNAINPVEVSDVRLAWASAMSSPLLLLETDLDNLV